MSKPYEGASVRPQALVLSPEAPYPAVGGGSMRTASLIDYLARRYNIDIITFRENPAERRSFPASRVRNTLVLDLDPHSKSTAARAARNIRRFLSARPPLLDRYSGQNDSIARWLANRTYSIAVVEHFWCAPYAAVLREHAARLVLDLHNIESALQQSTAASESFPMSAMFRRFAGVYRDLERQWLPKYDDLLVTSPQDAARAAAVAPAVPVIVYPNTIPRVELPSVNEEEAIAFSGNLAYHSNQIAIRWFAREVWPSLHARHPQLEWRLIGKGGDTVQDRAPGMRIVGEVEDAVRELAAAKIAVVPLTSGSGTRFKILEAWAACRAVVSTSLGAEGLGAVPGEHLLIADDAASFTTAIELLLADPAHRERLGASGRRLYLDKFTTDAAARVLDASGF